jgi:D-sorbitol dehydrogenase (acceptor)
MNRGGAHVKLEGKAAAITGAGSGMGKAIAIAYAREGAKIVAADLNLDAAQGTAGEIAAAGGEAIAAQIDVRERAQAQAMVDAAVDRFGGLDILVNNAGVGRIIPFLETTNDDWDFMFDVNCKGLLWCSQAAARQMIAQGRGGKIINLASQAGRRGEALVLA